MNGKRLKHCFMILALALASFYFLTLNGAADDLPQLDSVENLFSDATLLQIVCNPDKYSNQYVTIRGFLNIEFENTKIHYSKDDYIYSLGNCIRVSLENAEVDDAGNLSGNYVVMRGIYRSDRKSNFDFGEISSRP